MFEEKILKLDDNIKPIIIRAISYPNSKTYINSEKELIIIPHTGIYVPLKNIHSELDFKCKILEYLSYYVAQNHWDDKLSPKILDFINYVLKTNFTSNDLTKIYCVLGDFNKRDLTIKFVENNYNLSLLN